MRNPFAVCHPGVTLGYLALAIVLSMAMVHPAYTALAAVGALSVAIYTRGWRPSVRMVAYLAPFSLLIATLNACFVGSGSTVLCQVLGVTFYAESFAYGLCMGGMFTAMCLWFSVFGTVLDSEAVLGLLSNRVPAIALIISQIMRLVPQFVARGRAIADVQRAVSAVHGQTPRDAMRIVSVLMGWGMEDSLVRSASMRARGYTRGGGRTVYRRYRFRTFDGVLLGIVVLLAAVVGLSMVQTAATFHFYPVISGPAPWWGVLAYCLLMLVPFACAGREGLLWHTR